MMITDEKEIQMGLEVFYDLFQLFLFEELQFFLWIHLNRQIVILPKLSLFSTCRLICLVPLCSNIRSIIVCVDPLGKCNFRNFK